MSFTCGVPCCDIFSFIFFQNFGSREEQSRNQSWQFGQEPKRLGKKFPKEDGETRDERHARNRKKTKNAQELTARTENRQCPRPPSASLSLHSQNFRFAGAYQSWAFHLRMGWPASDAHSRNGHRRVFALYFSTENDTENNSPLLFPISGSVRCLLDASEFSATSLINCVLVYAECIKICTWLLNRLGVEFFLNSISVC